MQGGPGISRAYRVNTVSPFLFRKALALFLPVFCHFYNWHPLFCPKIPCTFRCFFPWLAPMVLLWTSKRTASLMGVLTWQTNSPVRFIFTKTLRLRMDEKKELTDLSKVDWANLSPQEFAQLLAEEMENRTEEDIAAAEAQSRFLVDRNPSPT